MEEAAPAAAKRKQETAADKEVRGPAVVATTAVRQYVPCWLVYFYGSLLPSHPASIREHDVMCSVVHGLVLLLPSHHHRSQSTLVLLFCRHRVSDCGCARCCLRLLCAACQQEEAALGRQRRCCPCCCCCWRRRDQDCVCGQLAMVCHRGGHQWAV